jgi:hypothetical protein
MFKKNRSNLTHWIAIIAVLMNFFAPSISQAVSSHFSKNSIDFEICSATGGKVSHHVVFENSGNDSTSEDDHCAFCTLQTFYLPPINSENYQFNQLSSFTFNSYLYRTPSVLIYWNLSSPRAPPSQA